MKLEEISTLLENITQGDWSFTLWGDCVSIDSKDKRIGHVAVHDGKGNQYKNHVSGDEGLANARLIAAAPEWLRLLVERVRKLERVMEQAEEVVAWADGNDENKGKCSISSYQIKELERALSKLKECL